MEDILEVYKRPYDKKRPLVCIDETTCQLIGEKRTALPMGNGKPKQIDYEYVRNGVAHLFMVMEPLAGKRRVDIGKSHTKKDFAHCLERTAEDHKDAEKIVLVIDNLDTHTLGSLYAAFPPEKARALAERFEIHYTPKHGSWLDMAEIEIGILNRQCLRRRIGNFPELEKQITAWQAERNRGHKKIRWQFTTKDARIKLQHLYPKL
jgi:hypothetical protein